MLADPQAFANFFQARWQPLTPDACTPRYLTYGLGLIVSEWAYGLATSHSQTLALAQALQSLRLACRKVETYGEVWCGLAT